MAMLDSIAAHRIWAATYDQDPNPLLALEQRTLASLLPPVGQRVVLDVASGTGRWARLLAAMGARVIALDACFEMVARGPRPAVIADVMRLPVPDACADVTICAFALSYTGCCLAELARATRPGGVVLVSDMHPDAVRLGWSRSFRAQGEVVSIRSRPYELDSLHCPGLRQVSLVEARFGAPERQIFAAANRLDRFADACAVPAIYVAKWIRHDDR